MNGLGSDVCETIGCVVFGGRNVLEKGIDDGLFSVFGFVFILNDDIVVSELVQFQWEVVLGR